MRIFVWHPKHRKSVWRVEKYKKKSDRKREKKNFKNHTVRTGPGLEPELGRSPVCYARLLSVSRCVRYSRRWLCVLWRGHDGGDVFRPPDHIWNTPLPSPGTEPAGFGLTASALDHSATVTCLFQDAINSYLNWTLTGKYESAPNELKLSSLDNFWA